MSVHPTSIWLHLDQPMLIIKPSPRLCQEQPPPCMLDQGPAWCPRQRSKQRWLRGNPAAVQRLFDIFIYSFRYRMEMEQDAAIWANVEGVFRRFWPPHPPRARSSTLTGIIALYSTFQRKARTCSIGGGARICSRHRPIFQTRVDKLISWLGWFRVVHSSLQ
jgi:hypothetical protein